MFNYPEHHTELIEAFLSGRFILHTDKLYDTVKENDEFYISFFKESFGYTLIISQNFTYIVSNESNEILSRDISIFFAILCYELDKNGKNFLEELEYGSFDYAQIDDLFENSSFQELIMNNNKVKDPNGRRNLFNEMARRNIIEKQNDETFLLTPAYKVFIEFATEIAKKKTTDLSE